MSVFLYIGKCNVDVLLTQYVLLGSVRLLQASDLLAELDYIMTLYLLYFIS